jgi:hypothetical protein
VAIDPAPIVDLLVDDEHSLEIDLATTLLYGRSATIRIASCVEHVGCVGRRRGGTRLLKLGIRASRTAR